MTKVNKILLRGSSLSLFLFFVGCGGGTSSNPTTTTQSPIEKTYSVSGTVPGTLIEALCKDGSYHKVKSIDNGTTEHPFNIQIPADVDCKLIMTTNEDDVDPRRHIVTPILWDNGSTISSYFKLSSDTNLGNIPLPLTGTGVQTPLTITTSEKTVTITAFTFDPLDKDKDNIPNIYEDDDNDGLTNIHDDDDDGDGILDKDDDDYKNDYDGDGIDNDYDDDDDNDEIKDKDDDDHDDINNYPSQITPTPILANSYKADAGRLLGSQCAQCHGTNGVSVNRWDSIAGENDLLDEIFDDEPIMRAQAHGYTTEEIRLMGNWLRTLNKNNDNDRNDDDDRYDND